MKKLLFVYTKMIIGGSTTALLSILNNLDTSMYSVDLILFFGGGELFSQIPSNINIHILLKDGQDEHDFEVKKKKSLAYILNYIKGIWMVKTHNRNHLILGQVMSKNYAMLLPDISKEYDAAFSFLEFSPAAYVAYKVKARKKYTWLHLDYKEAGMLPEIENSLFEHFNNVFFVSNSCLEGFIKVYPQYENKAMYLENIIDEKVTLRRASEKISEDIYCNINLLLKGINIVSSSRIVFEHKGYDRAVRALGRIKREHLDIVDYRWFVIGDGEDLNEMKSMVEKEGLGENVVFLGKQINPFPIIKQMDLFLLPSRREGKPMAVTEALQLGIPVLVTRYNSADEQVEYGVDGIVVDNNEEAIYLGLKAVLMKEINLSVLKRNTLLKKYCDFSALKKIYELVEKNE